MIRLIKEIGGETHLDLILIISNLIFLKISSNWLNLSLLHLLNVFIIINIYHKVALAWVMSKGDDIIPIPGTKSVERLKENIAAL